MRQILGVLFLAILLSQGLAPFLPLQMDTCTDDGCTPASCAQICPACVCALDRDRIAPQTFTALASLEPLDAAPHVGDPIPPVSFTRDILHVPKAPVA